MGLTADSEISTKGKNNIHSQEWEFYYQLVKSHQWPYQRTLLSGQRRAENDASSQSQTLEQSFVLSSSGGVVADTVGMKYSCKVAGKPFLLGYKQ